MAWNIEASATFAKEMSKFKKNRAFLDALDKKMQRLKEDPESIGGYLSGQLHGYKSTRIIRKFRLLFRIAPQENLVYLIAIDHRKHDYEGFNMEKLD